MEVSVQPLANPGGDAREVEIVERKGIGHPDTICDELSERLCQAICRFHLERFGSILHHNVDKSLLFAGHSEPAFGGGRVVDPMEIYLAGRAAREYRGVAIPVEEMAVEGSRAWLRSNLRHLDADRQVNIRALVRSGAGNLVDLFVRGKGCGLSNDTSIGAGFAPLSLLERLVLEIERQMNSADFHRAHPEAGEDVKVMGFRKGGRIRLTVSVALVDRYVADTGDYVRKREALRDGVAAMAARITGREVEVEVNAADNPAAGDLYLTVTGTSAESGDDGQTGRGNRANGLITPGRPMTLEAVAGKNPVSHVGKIYNIAAGRIAGAVYTGVQGILAVEVQMVSRIGSPVTEPQILEVRIATGGERPAGELREEVAEVAREETRRLDRFWEEWLEVP